jgi:hypothetical protein
MNLADNRMKLVTHALLMLVAASLGLAAGFTWKARRGEAETLRVARAADSETVGPAKATAAAKKLRPPRDDSPLATRLEQDLSMSSGIIKWLCWMSALEKAQATDFPRLAKLAHGNPVLWRFVVNRWVQIAPRNLFDTLVSISKFGGGLPVNELGSSLFSQWPKHEPEAAIAALNEPGDVGMRDAWRMQAAGAVVEKDAERGLQLMSEWHIEHFGPRMGAVDTWAAANPRHAA